MEVIVTSMSEQVVYRLADPPGDPFDPGHSPNIDPDSFPGSDNDNDPILDPLEPEHPFSGVTAARWIQ
jgi:hypothetical protein